MANASSDEEDYMSDAFLAKCENKRPGLVPDRIARQYKNEQRIKQKNKQNEIKPRKQMEMEKRDEGLNKAIGEQNKGFALLQKMGYKPGMALGKKGTGRLEPVRMEVRLGRGGLGRETEVKRKQEESVSMRAILAKKRMKFEEVHRRDFQARQSEKMAERRTDADLYRSQKVCEQLDSAQDVGEPAESFFWPPKQLPEKEESSDEEEEKDKDEDEEEEKEEKKEEKNEEEEDDDVIQLTGLEQLQVLTRYLRGTYLYCVWCGTTFNDKDDLSQNCPGDTAQAHDE